MSPRTPSSRCEPFVPLLDPYFDGELSGGEALDGLLKHLEGCEDCRLDLEARRKLREGVRSIPRPAALPALRESVRSRLIPMDARRPVQERMVRLMNRPVPALAVVAVSLLMIGTVGAVYSNYRSTSRLWPGASVVEPLVADHISLVQRDGGLSTPTRDPLELEAWFAERLLFSPPVPTWPWANLEGGRICFINGHRVARIQYSADGRHFSLFVQYVGKEQPQSVPKKCNSGSTATFAEKQGYKAAYWNKDGFSYVLVAHQSADPVFYNLQHE